jgi:hypothetical protein
MPSLQDLSIELRLRIYALAIGPQITAKIEAYSHSSAPNDSPADVVSIVRGHGTATPSGNNGNAIVRVSKQVRAEALPILYQHCEFEFESSRVLELFLNQIGEMKQHVRNISIATGGYEHDAGSMFGATKCALATLATIAGLQSFNISHFDLCCLEYNPRPETGIENFAGACSQFLHTLRASRSVKGLKTNTATVLDIVKVVLPGCVGCFSCNKPGPQRVSRNRSVTVRCGKINKRRRCRCKCSEAYRNNEELNKQLKRRLATDLGLE